MRERFWPEDVLERIMLIDHRHGQRVECENDSLDPTRRWLRIELRHDASMGYEELVADVEAAMGPGYVVTEILPRLQWERLHIGGDFRNGPWKKRTDVMIVPNDAGTRRQINRQKIEQMSIRLTS